MRCWLSFCLQCRNLYSDAIGQRFPVAGAGAPAGSAGEAPPAFSSVEYFTRLAAKCRVRMGLRTNRPSAAASRLHDIAIMNTVLQPRFQPFGSAMLAATGTSNEPTPLAV